MAGTILVAMPTIQSEWVKDFNGAPIMRTAELSPNVFIHVMQQLNPNIVTVHATRWDPATKTSTSGPVTRMRVNSLLVDIRHAHLVKFSNTTACFAYFTSSNNIVHQIIQVDLSKLTFTFGSERVVAAPNSTVGSFERRSFVSLPGVATTARTIFVRDVVNSNTVSNTYAGMITTGSGFNQYMQGVGSQMITAGNNWDQILVRQRTSDCFVPTSGANTDFMMTTANAANQYTAGGTVDMSGASFWGTNSAAFRQYRGVYGTTRVSSLWGTPVGFNSAGRRFIHNVSSNTGDFATGNVEDVANVGVFENVAANRVGFRAVYALNNNLFVQSYVEFQNDVDINNASVAPVFASNPVPLRLHMRFYTRISNTVWRVSDRSKMAGGYTVDLPTTVAGVTSPFKGLFSSNNAGVFLDDSFGWNFQFQLGNQITTYRVG